MSTQPNFTTSPSSLFQSAVGLSELIGKASKMLALGQYVAFAQCLCNIVTLAQNSLRVGNTPAATEAAQAYLDFRRRLDPGFQEKMMAILGAKGIVDPLVIVKNVAPSAELLAAEAKRFTEQPGPETSHASAPTA